MEIHVDDPMHNLHPCHCSPVYEPVGRWQGGWGKMLTGVHRTGHPIHLNIKSSSAEVTLWWAFIWDPNIFIFFAHTGSSIHISFPQFPCHQFSNHVPSQKSAQPGALLQGLPTGRISLRYHPSRTSQKGAVVLQSSIFRWCLHILQKAWSFSFSVS